MKRVIALGVLMLPLLAARADDRHWSFDDHETIHKTFQVATGDNVSKLLVDGINGYIHVTGGSGTQIQVTVERRTRGESKAALDNAKKDVKLDITQQGNNVKVYEDGPFRSSNGDLHYRGEDYYGYSVVFDCDIEVPSGATLDLRTMNGAITAKHSTGEFKMHTSNGAIDMEEIGSSGSAETMNGRVKVAFSRNPARESSFHTMNGAIDLYFASTPDADLALQTMNGGVFADFEVTTLPTTVKSGNLANRFVYRNGGEMKVRAGKGGTALSLKTMNGAIRLHSKI